MIIEPGKSDHVLWNSLHVTRIINNTEDNILEVTKKGNKLLINSLNNKEFIYDEILGDWPFTYDQIIVKSS